MIKYKDILQSIKESHAVDFIMDNDSINNDFIFSIRKDLENEYVIKEFNWNNNILEIQNEINLSHNKTIIFIKNTEKLIFSKFFNEIIFKDNIILIFLRDINNTSNTMLSDTRLPNSSLSWSRFHSVFLLSNKKFKILKDRILPYGGDLLSLTILIRESKLRNIIK